MSDVCTFVMFICACLGSFQLLIVSNISVCVVRGFGVKPRIAILQYLHDCKIRTKHCMLIMHTQNTTETANTDRMHKAINSPFSIQKNDEQCANKSESSTSTQP